MCDFLYMYSTYMNLIDQKSDVYLCLSPTVKFQHFFICQTPPTGWVYVHKYKIVEYMNIQLENHEAETINLK